MDVRTDVGKGMGGCEDGCGEGYGWMWQRRGKERQESARSEQALRCVQCCEEY